MSTKAYAVHYSIQEQCEPIKMNSTTVFAKSQKHALEVLKLKLPDEAGKDGWYKRHTAIEAYELPSGCEATLCQ